MANWFMEEVSRAATEAHGRMMREPYLQLYLYYRPGDGGLRFFDRGSQPEGWELGADTPLSPGFTLEQAKHWTLKMSRSLPCLPLEPADVLELLGRHLARGLSPEEATHVMISQTESAAGRRIIKNTVWQSPEGLKLIRKHIQPAAFEVANLDVWGNPREGWSVEGATMAGEILLPWHATDRERLDALKRSGHLEGNVRLNQVLFASPSDPEDFFEVYQRKDRKPLYTLTKIGR